MARAGSGQRLYQTKVWIYSLGWSIAGLAGCATFDQKYERVEIPDSSRLNATEARKKALHDSIRAKQSRDEQPAEIDDESAVPLEHSAHKPISTSRVNPETRSAIHLASYQDPATSTKPGPPPSASIPLTSAPIPKTPAATTVESLGVTVPDPNSPAIESPSAIPGPGDVSAGLQQITLEQAVFETENSFLLQAEAERMNQAYADYTTASLLPNPTVSTIASLQPFPGRPFTVTKQGGPPQYDLGIDYPFDWLLFGKRKAAMMAAGTWTAVAEAEYQDVLRQRLALTRSAYFDVLEARELRDLARQDVTNLNQVLKMTKAQIALGGAGTIEEDRVKLALLTAERELNARETAVKNLKSQLRTLMGRTEVDPDFEVAGSLDITAPIPPMPAEELLVLAQESRPDILSARRQVDWAMNEVYSEERKAKPKFEGSFGLTYQLQRKAIGFPNAPSYGGGVTFSMPLFDRNQGNITKAQSKYSQATHNLQARLSNLQSEVDQAATSYMAAYQAATSTNVAQANAARNVRDKVVADYDAGGRPLIEVLDTERTFRETSRLLINGRANYWKSLYQLNAVTGATVAQ